jgi:hypothetical protein
MRYAAAAALVVLAAAPAAAQTPPEAPALATVLERAGAYVREFQRQLSGIVAREHYVQKVESYLTQRRELVSDLLLVRPIGADRWVQFRDVYEVDGKPVRDRNDRLTKLFLEPTESIADQIERIVVESTRYNIGGVQRTVNAPVLPLVFLDPTQQPRFHFTRATHTGAPRGFDDPPRSAWTIQYQEVEPETMIRTTFGHDMPSHGRFWIEPDTGRVLMSELIAEDSILRGEVVVSYRDERSLGLLVPAEMRERYIPRSGYRVEGTATYSNFRQFTVSVDEKLAPVVKR